MSEDPRTDERGWFEPVIGLAPSTWPWTYPHYYAINTAPDPGEVVTGAVARVDGAYVERKRRDTARTRWELVAYWKGEFHVCEAMQLPTPAVAEELAARDFREMPVRYLMRKGKKIRENSDVALSGSWPRPLPLRGFRDLGVLCALLYEEARARGGAEAAEALKSRLGRRWPASVMIGMYVQALRDSLESLKPFLEPRSIAEIESAIRIGREWISPLSEDEV